MRPIHLYDSAIADISGTIDDAWRHQCPRDHHIPVSRHKHAEFCDNYPAQYRLRIEQIRRDPDFFNHLQPLPGAIEAILEMNVQFKVYPVVRVRPGEPAWTHHMLDWIRRHLGDDIADHCMVTPCTQRWPRIITDNVEIHRPRDSSVLPINCILVDRPYNHGQRPIARLAQWSRWQSLITPSGFSADHFFDRDFA